MTSEQTPAPEQASTNEEATTAPEQVAETEAPKRRTRRATTKTVTAAEEATDAPDASADAKVEGEAAAEEQPKRRGRRTKAQIEADKAAEEAAKQSSGEEPAAEEKPKRRPRRTKAQIEADKAAEEAAKQAETVPEQQESSAADEKPEAAAEKSDAQHEQQEAPAEQSTTRSRSRRGRGKQANDATAEPNESSDAADSAQESSSNDSNDANDSNDSNDEPSKSSRSRRGRGRNDDNGNKDDQKNDSGNGDDGDDDSGDGRGRRRRGRGNNNRDNRDDNKNESRNDNNKNESRNDSNRRTRDRSRRNADADPEIREDDVLLPIAGILEVLDNYAFVRTSGYLPGANDVYVSLGQVKKYNLRKGDAVVGSIKQPREGEQHNSRQKYNALAKIDTINGRTPDENAKRVDFDEQTAVYPTERFKLENEAANVTARAIDLVAPIGKGQRGLIVAPPKSGKSTVLQSLATAIAATSPETHLMVVLVDERPEEVTEFQRNIKGEVIASTFDRPAEDQTTVAELAIERAKRLVELGHDVVVLLDGISRLARAYNQSAPASGRVVSGAVDANALYATKKFFGAARNLEEGGSLTIVATAAAETGSVIDEAILEEFTGTNNMELRLSRRLADKRVFPAFDVSASGTRRDDLLQGADEIKVMGQVRKALADADAAVAEDVLRGIGETATNVEYLVRVQKTLHGADKE